MNNEELVRKVLAKLCQDNFNTDYKILLSQMGEVNDNFEAGLRYFVAKLYSKKRYSVSGKGGECLGAIYSFFSYNEPLDTDNLQSYLSENNEEGKNDRH